MVSFKIIVCVDSNYGYSKQKQIPWHLDMKGEEMKYFKSLTSDVSNNVNNNKNILIMGRNTWEDIENSGKHKSILKTRDIIIISKTLQYKEEFLLYGNVKICKSVWECLLHIHTHSEYKDSIAWVCGGKQIWYDFLKLKIVEKLHISYIPIDYNCDEHLDKLFLIKNFELIHSDETKKTFFVDTYKYVNKEECKFLNTVKKIIDKGYESMDRSGVGTLSIFGKSFTYDIKNYRLPLFTHRKMFLRGIIEELIFFISGETDTKILENKGVNIWKTHTSESFLKKRNLTLKEGDYGPSYGFQLRNWGSDGTDCGFDQLKYIVNLLKTDPHSRRIIFSYWNPNFIDKVPLPPCHILYMFNVNDKNELSCSFTQRSNDFALAGNFNICSASILVFILCKVCNLKPGKIIHNIGNIHLYKNQLEYVNNFIDNEPYNFPLIDVKKKENCWDYNIQDFSLMFYKSHKKYFIPISE
jgi:dihydrofolate reductase / thymidylate synthase